MEIRTEEKTIQTGDKSIFGCIWYPAAPGKRPAVILSHGYNGCHSDFDRECRFFAQNGVIAYSFDFCGGSVHSRSSGRSTDMTLFTEKADLLAVIDAVSRMDSADPDALFLLGGSQGGLVTALAAEERSDRLRGMILYFPAFNIPEDWRSRFRSAEEIPETYPFWGLTLGRDFFVSMRDFVPFGHVGGFPGPVLIFQGDQDQIVPLAVAQQAAQVYPQAKLTVLPGEGHGFSPAAAARVMETAFHQMIQGKSLSARG